MLEGRDVLQSRGLRQMEGRILRAGQAENVFRPTRDIRDSEW